MCFIKRPKWSAYLGFLARSFLSPARSPCMSSNISSSSSPSRAGSIRLQEILYNRIAIARTWVESWWHRRPRLRPSSPSFSSSHRRSGQLTGLKLDWNNLFLLSFLTCLEINDTKWKPTWVTMQRVTDPVAVAVCVKKYENILKNWNFWLGEPLLRLWGGRIFLDCES